MELRLSRVSRKLRNLDFPFVTRLDLRYFDERKTGYQFQLILLGKQKQIVTRDAAMSRQQIFLDATVNVIEVFLLNRRFD